MQLLLHLKRQQAHYLTLTNLFNALFVSIALIEFYQPDGFGLFAEAKKKKILVVKHVGMGYKKVPVYKKVPYKILKVEIKKKKSKKPWKKWFKKQMIVKIPHEHHHHGHHGHHHAASEGHQTWTLPAFISSPSSMNEIMDAWPTDYGNANKQQQQQQSAASQQQQQATAAAAATSTSVSQSAAQSSSSSSQLPTSISDLKSFGSEAYPAYLAEAAAQLIQSNQFAFPPLQDYQQQQQQQQLQADAEEDRLNKFKSLLSDSSELKQLLGLQSTLSHVFELPSEQPSPEAANQQQQQQHEAAQQMQVQQQQQQQQLQQLQQVANQLANSSANSMAPPAGPPSSSSSASTSSNSAQAQLKR